MAWSSREGWLHGVKFLFVQVELKAPMNGCCTRSIAVCEMRKSLPWRKDMTSNVSLGRCVLVTT